MDEVKKPWFLCLSSFWLKVIAVITMTFDHVGLFLMNYASPNYSLDNPKFWEVPMSATGYVFRVIGRLALPLFCILLVEGLKHTHSRRNYVFRLGIMAAIILIAQLILTYAFKFYMDGNIFFTLIAGALFIIFLEKPKWYKALALLPLAYVIMSSIISIINYQGNYVVTWFPSYLKPQYEYIGFLIIILGYYSYPIADKLVRRNFADAKNYDNEFLRGTIQYREIVNGCFAFSIFIVMFLYWVIARINPSIDVYYTNIQSYAIIAAIFVLMYNGLKGYKSKKLQYAFYLYYPIHILVIYLIFLAIFHY